MTLEDGNPLITILKLGKGLESLKILYDKKEAIEKMSMAITMYLWNENLTQEQFAEMICYSPQHLVAVKNGRRKASPRFKYMVDMMTNGKVKL